MPDGGIGYLDGLAYIVDRMGNVAVLRNGDWVITGSDGFRLRMADEDFRAIFDVIRDGVSGS